MTKQRRVLCFMVACCTGGLLMSLCITVFPGFMGKVIGIVICFLAGCLIGEIGYRVKV